LAGGILLTPTLAESKRSKDHQGTRTDFVPTLAQSEIGKSRDKVAEKIGILTNNNTISPSLTASDIDTSCSVPEFLS